MVDDPAAFAGMSVAARGFFALDWLLFDPAAGAIEAGSYRCRLLVAIARDAAATSATLLAAVARSLGGDPDQRRGGGESGLLRAGRGEPGALRGADRGAAVRHRRAAGAADGDASSGRSRGGRRPGGRGARSRNVNASLVALKEYARAVFGPALPESEMDSVIASFDGALAAVTRVAGPIDVEVATPQGRVHVEALQSSIRSVQTQVAEHVGPGLGVSAGFNSMDGD